jgi:transposase
MKTKLYPWGESRKRTYVHVYYNSHAAAAAFDKFTEELLTYKDELESGQFVKNHEEFYKRYFIIKETPKRGRKVRYDNEAVQKHRNRYSGFFVLLSNATKDAMEALQIYRNKDVVENCFDDLKNQIDMKRLRVHKSFSMDSRLFVQFLALIFISALREKIRSIKELENYTVRELLEEMDTLTKITYSGRYGSIISEVTKKQRIIMEALSLEL